MPRPMKARTAKRRTGTGIDEHDRIVEFAHRDMMGPDYLNPEEDVEFRRLRRDHSPTCAACHSQAAGFAMVSEHPNGRCKTEPGFCPALNEDA